MWANGLGVCMLSKDIRTGVINTLLYYLFYATGLGLWYLIGKITKD